MDKTPRPPAGGYRAADGVDPEPRLEKPPLQTGQTTPDVSARTKAVTADEPWVERRRMAGWIALGLIIVLILLAAALIGSLTDFFDSVREAIGPLE